jgi:hypothetical protein
MKWIASAWLCMGLAVACGGGSGGGGGSGVTGSKKLVDLSTDEITSVCEFQVELAGPARTIDCGGGQTATVGGGSVADCVSSFQDQQTSNPSCMATPPAACAPLATAECSN